MQKEDYFVDIFSFINSKDIRDYLREKDYHFNSLEAAWLIYQSQNHSLEQKYRAWEAVIHGMPDCEMPGRLNCTYRQSLHAFLRQYMDVLKRYQKLLEQKLLSQDFSNLHICVEADLEEEEGDLLLNSFEGLWFDFPIPFKKGDILITGEREKPVHEPFVLLDVAPWRAKENVRLDGDNLDMNITGHFLNKDGTVYTDVMLCNYMDCEYSRENLTGKRRLLVALSNFEKGKLEIGLLLFAYRKILLEEAAKDPAVYGFTKEGLELAGLGDSLEK